MSDVAVDPNVQVSHEVDGRVLTGVGVAQDDLAETMDRHTSDIETPADPVSPASQQTTSRDDQGKFKPTRGQRRFDELTREREDARREAAELRRERDDLRARQSAPVDRQPEPPSRPAVSQSAVSRANRPEPTEDDIGVKYNSYSEMTKDQALWVWEQQQASLQEDIDARVRKGIEADRASRSFVDQVSKVFTEARQDYPDFDAVLATGPGAQVDFGTQRRDWMVQHPQSRHILYTVARDGALAHRLSQMSDIDFGIAVSSLAPQPGASQASPAAAPVPAPYQPVGSGSKTSVVASGDLPKRHGSDFDSSGYREKRARERGLRR